MSLGFSHPFQRKTAPDSSASSSVGAGTGRAESHRAAVQPQEGIQRQRLCDGAEPLPPLAKTAAQGYFRPSCVRLLTCTICSCKSQSISTFLNCWNAFLNTVIYLQKNLEHTPLPMPRSTNCHPLPTPHQLTLHREGRKPPLEPQQKAIVHKPLDKNFYFFLMTLNTTATRGKNMIHRRHQTSVS